ncbi:GNAT family N-acetyltransferase [Streptomyces sp. NPDC127039]|uniref:GNAT family N-acetyltransferase n=1 Tax=Streptomyces sp. NPDC127039 TaxID=3347115 RepID=UPI00365E2857
MPASPAPSMTWPPDPGTELTGHFVRLVPLDLDQHPQGLFDALDSASVWEYFGAPRPANPRQAAQGLALLAGLPGRHQWTVLAATADLGVPVDTVLGMTSYFDVSPTDARLEIGATAYSPDVWATAVNPETKLLLLRHAFETLGCGRVQFRTDVENERSRRAILGLGAHFEGILLRYERRVDGTLRDTALYSVTADMWPAVADRLRQRVAAFLEG